MNTNREDALHYEWREETIEDLIRIGRERESFEQQQLERAQRETREHNIILKASQPLKHQQLAMDFSSSNHNRFTSVQTPTYYTDNSINASISPTVQTIQTTTMEDVEEVHLRTASEPTPVQHEFPLHVRSKSESSALRERGEKRYNKELVFDCYGNKKRKKARPGDAYEMTFTLK
jgi:hypothetical protein